MAPKACIAYFGILAVMVVPILMLFMMSLPAHHGHSECPFMLDDASFCPMSFSDHVQGWQQAFVSIALELLVPIVVTVSLVLFWIVARKPEPPPGYMRTTYPAPPLFQLLFSKGLLHPKIP